MAPLEEEGCDVMDIFTVLQQIITTLCHELQDAYRMATPARPAQLARAEILLAMMRVLNRALIQAADTAAVSPQVRRQILAAVRKQLAQICKQAADKGSAYSFAAEQTLTAMRRTFDMFDGRQARKTPECSPAF